MTVPPTAMYFISCLLEERIEVENPGRKSFSLADDMFFWPWIGLYNSHLFHAYWLMIGDAFHLTAQEYGSVQRPDGWQDARMALEDSWGYFLQIVGV